MSENPPTFPEEEILAFNERLAGRTPEDILRWTWETFGTDVVASSSFQTQSIPLLHMISRVCGEMPVIFVDTGFHFPETLTFCDEVKKRLGLNIRVVHPAIEKSALLLKYGEGLYRHDPDLCCYINKVEPMQRALSGLRAWVSGARADQTPQRQALRVVEQGKRGVLEIRPVLGWTRADVEAYFARHPLPVHPLFHDGYASIGCAPCTRPVSDDGDERSGRWSGMGKTECGLHIKTPASEEKDHEQR